MFRENVLTKDAIIDRIATTMIPIAVDRWMAEDPTTGEARFLQPFLQAHPPQGSPCIYSPDGQVLGAFKGYHDMAGRTKTLIDDALQAFGPVTPRKVEPVETHPDRGKGVRPDGSLSLAQTIRPSEDSVDSLNTKTPVISSMILTEDEAETLSPREVEIGFRWTLPEAVARKFSRITSPLCFQHAPQPDWVTTAQIDGEVRSTEDGVARLVFTGQMASKHEGGDRTISSQQTDLNGEGIYHLESGQLQSLLLIGTGRLQWPEAPKKVVTFEALAEWSR